MCEKIYKAVSDNFIRQMRNWALTNSGCIGGRRTISSIYSGSGGDTYGDSGCPVLIGEAEDVSQALSKLPARYKQAVSLFWQYEGRSMSWFASRCGQGVDRRTYERRVIDGHNMLIAELASQAEKVRRYRSALILLSTA